MAADFLHLSTEDSQRRKKTAIYLRFSENEAKFQ